MITAVYGRRGGFPARQKFVASKAVLHQPHAKPGKHFTRKQHYGAGASAGTLLPSAAPAPADVGADISGSAQMDVLQPTLPLINTCNVCTY